MKKICYKISAQTQQYWRSSPLNTQNKTPTMPINSAINNQSGAITQNMDLQPEEISNETNTDKAPKKIGNEVEVQLRKNETETNKKFRNSNDPNNCDYQNISQNQTQNISENRNSQRTSLKDSGSYDISAAQTEYDLTGTVTQKQPSTSSSSKSSSNAEEEHFEDAKNDQDQDLYTEVDKVVKERYQLSQFDVKEYNVPKIQFCFIDSSSELEPQHQKPCLQQRVKFGSDPNLKYRKTNENDEDYDEDDDSDDENLYKVPKSSSNNNNNRLSKSLHDFHDGDELNLPPLSLSDNDDEDIEHISCSQVIPQYKDSSPKRQHSNNKTVTNDSNSFALLSRTRAADTWHNFKSKFSRVMEEHAQNQRVGAFADKEKLALNIEEMYRSSKDKCKRVLKNTGKMFKRPESSSNSSQMVKNDAFFAKIKASDIEYVLPHLNKPSVIEEGCRGDNEEKEEEIDNCDGVNQYAESNKGVVGEMSRSAGVVSDSTVKVTLDSVNGHRKSGGVGFRRRSRIPVEGQNGFDDLRRYVKQGGDFCKELASILQERSDAELQYSKSLSKLSSKLSRACREGVGGLNEAWKTVAVELETRAEAHRQMAHVLLEETAKPLKTLSETQHRTRKSSEGYVDKAARVLADWRAAEAKSKKHSHVCARDNEKLQDAMLENRISRSTSLIQLPNMYKGNSDKDTAKLEGKKRKAEDAVKKADIEYYSHCVRSERARLEWESAVLKGTSTFQGLEDERLHNLKSTLNLYLQHSTNLTPKLIEATERTRDAIEQSDPYKDLGAFTSLRQSSQQISEQLLPDFYCEHITLAMNRERRKQALVKLLQLIKLDIEREKKSKDGLENLSKAIKQTPNFGAEDSQQTVIEKLYHMKSMLAYLEGARYKVQNALAELDCRPRTGHPLASHITVTRDKAGLQQSILKVPIWLREQWTEDEKKEHMKESEVESTWIDRGMADGNSNQPDSDFDEFSSQGSSICGGICNTEDSPVQPIAQCRALYIYTPNLQDELALRPGDTVSVYRQQEDGWWLGECNGSIGIFPASYVEPLKISS